MESRIKNTEITFAAGYMLGEEEYFNRVVRILSAAHVTKEDQLTERELEYLYCAYRCISGGSRKLIEMMNLSKYFKSFKDKNTAKLWLGRVINKGWIEEYNGNYYIIGDFEKMNNLDITRFRVDLIKTTKKNEVDRRDNNK